MQLILALRLQRRVGAIGPYILTPLMTAYLEWKWLVQYQYKNMYVIQLPTISVSQRKAQSGPPMESFYLSYQPSSLPLFLTHHPPPSFLPTIQPRQFLPWFVFLRPTNKKIFLLFFFVLPVMNYICNYAFFLIRRNYALAKTDTTP